MVDVSLTMSRYDSSGTGCVMHIYLGLLDLLKKIRICGLRLGGCWEGGKP